MRDRDRASRPQLTPPGGSQPQSSQGSGQRRDGRHGRAAPTQRAAAASSLPSSRPVKDRPPGTRTSLSVPLVARSGLLARPVLSVSCRCGEGEVGAITPVFRSLVAACSCRPADPVRRTKIVMDRSRRPTLPQRDRSSMIRSMRDSGTTPDGSDRAVATGAPTPPTTWLRASGRALRKAASWFIDRIGFLAG